MAFTEFYCNHSTGDNLNGGSSEGSPTATDSAATYGRDTGAGGLDRITASSGTPFSGVSVGEFVGVKAAGGSAPADFVCRVTAVNGGGASIDVSDAAASGTRPANAASVDVKVGGAWKGPNGASGFPFGFVTSALTDASSNPPRVNLKNNAQYDITAAVTHGNGGPIYFEGYSSSAGDGGRAAVDGGTGGASYILLTVSQPLNFLRNLAFANNGATGTAVGISLSAARCELTGVVVHDVRGTGVNIGGASRLVECEAYGCNQANSSGTGGFSAGGAGVALLRCVSHDNGGSNNDGFTCFNAAGLVNCVADSNGRHGVYVGTTNPVLVQRCTLHNSGTNGVLVDAASPVHVENCILTSNGGYGVAASSAANGRQVDVASCAFRSNTSGETNNVLADLVTGSVTLTGDPFADAANGDFDLNDTAGAGAACRNAGRGVFTQTAASYSGTVSYPDIGAVQHQDSGGGGSSGPVAVSKIIQNIGTY